MKQEMDMAKESRWVREMMQTGTTLMVQIIDSS